MRLSGPSIAHAPPPQPAKDFAWADGHWAVYSTCHATVIYIITKSVVIRRVFRSKNGQVLAAGGTALPRPPSWSKGGERQKRGGEDRRDRREVK